MAVSQMEKIFICALNKDKQKLVGFLQRQSCVELIELAAQEDTSFALSDYGDTIERLKADYSLALQAEEYLAKYSPLKLSMFASFEGKEGKTVAEYEDFHINHENVNKIAKSICGLEDNIHAIKDEISRLKEKRESLIPWEQSPVPLSFSLAGNTIIRIGTLPKGYTEQELLGELEGLEVQHDQFVLQIFSSSQEQTCLAAIALKRHEDLLEKTLGQLQFAPPSYVSGAIPKDELIALEAEINEKQDLVNSLINDIKSFSEHREELRFLIDYLSISVEEYQAFNQIGEARHVFLISGFILSSSFDAIKAELEQRFACMVKSAQITDEDEAPSLMKNNSFSQPVESIVASYNYPKYKGIDPTKLTSFFYYFMFGLMFSDAGYGAILVLACGFILIKFKNLNKGMSSMMKLFFWCGVSTVAWGIVFSSYFGDVVDVFSNAFLGRSLTIPPLWFSPLEDPMRLLLFCLTIGIVHLTVGYGANAYISLRNRDLKSAIYDSLLPVLFLYSLLIVFVGTEMFGGLAGFTLSVGPIVTNICLGIAALCAVGVLLTSGRESRSWVKRLLKGAFGLYNVIAGWVSDILSYSRLLALGLATGVIASVINTLGAMVGKGVAGMVVFFIIFIFGHALNFGINILGSYVHSNRLEYVEFYGKFYEGGGREFKPLSLNTKYYDIKKEI